MICYASAADKRERFPRETIPAIFRAAAAVPTFTLADWLGQVAMMGPGVEQLRAVHDLARAGRYRTPAALTCDPQQPARDTILHGGDCDQWAAVLLAGLKYLGYTARLVTFGDRTDPYQHVAVDVEHNGRVFILDPKGSQAGAPFNVAPPHPIAARWIP